MVTDMGEITPSESEWMIMEVLWKAKKVMTASEIIKELEGVLDVSDKTIRVMINRLVSKGMLNYFVDPNDSRIYHYEAARSREECLEIKSGRFVKNYFGGDASLAVASFLRSADITKEQLGELAKLVEQLEKEK